MFLIGAPLGAIIKKGGLGVPTIVSVGGKMFICPLAMGAAAYLVGLDSLVVLIVVDLLLLTMLFDGLAEHRKQLTTPLDFAPAACRGLHQN